MNVATPQIQAPDANAARMPTLYISMAAWIRMMTYVNLSPVEINGFGLIQQISPNSFWIGTADNIFITQQRVTMGSADVEGNIFAKAVYQASLMDRSDDLRMQWHSHVNGGAYFSSTDMGTIESYGLAGMEWFISLVTNKRGDVRARLDQFRPFRVGFDLPIQVALTVDDETERICNENFNRLVTVVTPPPRPTGKRSGKSKLRAVNAAAVADQS